MLIIKFLCVSFCAASLTVIAGGFAGFLYACLRKNRDFDRFPAPGTEKSPREISVSRNRAAVEYLDGHEYEDVSITSYDGKKLCARLYLGEQSEKFIVAVHGYRSSFGVDFGEIAKFWYDKGYGVLAITQRAHGESGGRFITYGVKECRDVHDWCEMLTGRFPRCKIILHGISMGGATVIMAAETDLPHSVVGIIDDCGYSDPLEEIAYIAKKNLHLPRVFTISANLWCRLICGVSLDCPVTRAAARCTLPKLFIHGKDDSFVPFSAGEENFRAAAEPKIFISVDGAAHALSHYTAGVELEGRLYDFAKSVMR